MSPAEEIIKYCLSDFRPNKEWVESILKEGMAEGMKMAAEIAVDGYPNQNRIVEIEVSKRILTAREQLLKS